MGKHILFKNKKVHYTLHGKGKAIVMLHGFTESLAMWKYFSRKLSADHAVLCIDLPGHGRSEVIQPSHTMEFMAEVVHAVLKEAGIRTCLMAGHSMGGYVTLAYAEKYPKQLKGICLFHSHAASDSKEASANRDRTIKVVEHDKKGFIQQFIPGLFDPGNLEAHQEEISNLKAAAMSMPKEAIIAAIQGMKVRPDRTHVLANTRLPVQFIIGKGDPRIPLELIMRQTLLPAHSEALILDNIGHMGFLEAREKTFATLRGFANKVFS